MGFVARRQMPNKALRALRWQPWRSIPTWLQCLVHRRNRRLGHRAKAKARAAENFILGVRLGRCSMGAAARLACGAVLDAARLAPRYLTGHVALVRRDP